MPPTDSELQFQSGVKAGDGRLTQEAWKAREKWPTEQGKNSEAEAWCQGLGITPVCRRILECNPVGMGVAPVCGRRPTEPYYQGGLGRLPERLNFET